ncbi:DUF397 domain-containing protein [Thermomonospora umbrina]|uniref:Uncharacterized protein DUF397 n=1 Tax=Thermomonospora umbrina TaxID=111806 RepID=A0A3D9SXL3_9ACTN|nr:DUF397 domain-containing protein [Thermomonospora umbrina]REE96341.1 uncharacterized protein DUF397 [Thermomonospora umbrina]
MNAPDLAAARWRKSSYTADGQCVELADLVPHVAVRDSKDPNGPALVFPSSEFANALRRIKAERHDVA